MKYIYNTESQLTIYLSKQKKFINLVKSIKEALSSKEYKKLGYTFDTYSKKNWNISKAQAYRYLLSSKVLKELEEFEILPNYERLCKSLYDLTKTSEQLKLLWKTILKKVENRLNEINSLLATEVWNELCKDEKYNYICHSNNTITKYENVLNKSSRRKIYEKINSINNNKKDNNSNNKTKINNKNSNKGNKIKINDIKFVPENFNKINTSTNTNKSIINNNSQTF